MHTKHPTESECRSAAARYPTLRIADRSGAKRWHTYGYFVVRKGRRTSSSITDEVRLGALDIAAGNSQCEVNAALRRAAVLMDGYAGDAPRNLLEQDLALSMLRYGWRRCGGDDANYAAEVSAQSLPDTWVSLDVKPVAA